MNKKSLNHGITLAIPALMIVLAVGCNQPQDTSSSKQRVIDSLVQQIQSLKTATPMGTTAGPSGHKGHKVHSKANSHRIRTALCVTANFVGTDYDSLVVIVTAMKPVGHDVISSTFAQLTFSKKFVKNAAIRFTDKGDFDLELTSFWYKGTNPPEEGTWCDLSTCTIPENEKCTDVSTNVATTKTNSTGSSTATVSVDEQ